MRGTVSGDSGNSSIYILLLKFIRKVIERNEKRQMQENIHGGDIYSRQIRLDFSVNVNPLGIPKPVEQALHAAVDHVGEYPDITARKLKQAVSQMLLKQYRCEIPAEYLLFGSGASELFMAIVHGVCSEQNAEHQPKQIVIPVPSFYGYEHAAKAVDSRIKYVPLKYAEQLPEQLPDNTELLFLANPNNPTGSLWNKADLKNLSEQCRRKNITVVLDECFIEFCEKNPEHSRSMLTEIANVPNLIIVRAFTKIFAIPGVRLGYLVCSNQVLLEKIQRQLPEWNLSVLAQMAGVACAENCEKYLQDTVEYVETERVFLRNGLEKLGIRVVSGEANFLLLQTEQPIHEKLLQKGILIRNCGNFRGLGNGYYRIAVKRYQENEELLRALRECLVTETV